MIENLRRKAGYALCSLVLLSLLSVPAELMACGPASSPVKLPYALNDATSDYTGEKAYIFGGATVSSEGAGQILDKILCYDPADSSLSELPTRLPLQVKAARSFWDGRSAYIFSGVNRSGVPLDYLVRFTPPEKVEYWEHFFPYGLKGCSVAWTDQFAYIFGNCVCTSLNTTRQNVIRLDPATLNFTVIRDALPLQLAGTSAVWTGQYAYIFGGRTPDGTATADLDSIYRFDPATEMCALMKARLPSPRYSTGAVMKDGKADIFGGDCASGSLDQVLVYDPAVDRLSVPDLKLPYNMSTSSYVLVEDQILIFGAKTAGTSPDTVEVVTLKPAPKAAPAQSLSKGELTLVAILMGFIALVAIGTFFSRRNPGK